MSNRKDYRWCRRCRQWVFSFPLGVGQTCPQCWKEIAETPTPQESCEQEAAIFAYLVQDYPAC